MMSTRKRFLATVWLLAAGPAAEADPVHPIDRDDFVAFTVQDVRLTLSADDLTPEEWLGEADCCQVTVSPPEVPGSLVTSIGDEIHYDPAPDYFGRDAIAYQATMGQQTREGTVSAYVAPRIVPLSGRWDPLTTVPVRDALGFFDSLTGTFHLCRADRATINCGSELRCIPYRLATAGPGWLPMAGDWQGDGIDRPGLLDPSTRMLYLLDFPAGGYCPDCTGEQALQVASSFTIGEPGDVPLLGDWAGAPGDTIAIYRRAQNDFHLHAFDRDAEGVVVGVLPDPLVVDGFGPADPGSWPVAIESAGRHRLGLYHPRNGAFEGRDPLAPAAPTTLAVHYVGRSGIAVAGDWLDKGDDQLAVYDRDTHFFESIIRAPAIPPTGTPDPTDIYELEVGWEVCYTMVARFPEDPDDPP